MIETGTRTRQNRLSTVAAPQGHISRSFTRDVGLSKNVTASLTFGSGAIMGANGTFTAFAGGEIVFAQGTNRNNDYFTVTGIDATNHAFLTVSPPPKAEGPLSATVRTA